jgi:hypothetical protein
VYDHFTTPHGCSLFGFAPSLGGSESDYLLVLFVPALAACWALITSKKSTALTTRSRAGAETSVPFQFSAVVGVYRAVIS